MAMAIANPEELKNFANILSKYIETLDQETGVVLSAFSSLESSWQDQQQSKFKDILDELIVILNRFKEETSEQIPYLLKMAEDLESYLGR